MATRATPQRAAKKLKTETGEVKQKVPKTPKKEEKEEPKKEEPKKVAETPKKVETPKTPKKVAETPKKAESKKEEPKKEEPKKEEEVEKSAYELEKEKKEKEILAKATSVLEKELYAPVEERVGIECFLGAHEGFSGILKQRYGDFLVSEIDANGNVVQLNDTEAPVIEEVAKPKGTDKEAFTALVGAKKTKEFFEYMKKRADDKTLKFQFAAETDKLKRSKLHKLIKERFKDVLTETHEDAVIVMPAAQPRTRRDDASKWPEGKGKYVEFTLYKENRDTMSALLVLAKLLRTTTKAFSFAGTKDKRGVTVQRATAYMIDPERLSASNPKLFGMKVGNFSFVENPMRLGDLKGNKFNLVIRDVKVSDAAIKLAVENLTKNGFINYYGLQRFGTGGVGTNHIGLALLKKDWAGAAHLILDPRLGEMTEATEARVFYQKTGDIKGTLEIMPKFLSVERMLLAGLKKSGPTAFLNAFSMIPRTMRMMFVHAYQSLVWNVAVSERIRLFGLKPVVGDLVALEEKAEDAEDSDEDIDMERDTDDVLEMKQSNENFKVAVVTKEDVASKKYTIDQVVVPLPGYDITYPQNVIGEKIKERLKSDGLDPDNLQRAQKEYSLKGAYRKIIVKPTEVSWRTMQYDDVTISLLPTDVDKLNKAPEPVDVPNGKHKALILSFHLPTSCYATMLFRELLKMSTAKMTQKSLSDEFAYRNKNNNNNGDDEKNNNNNNNNNDDSDKPKDSKPKDRDMNFNKNRREKNFDSKRKRDNNKQ